MKRFGVYLLLMCVTMMSCTKQNANPLPVVEVELNMPVDTIKGTSWDRKSDGTLFDVKCVQSPCDVRVRFPGGQVYSSYSKILFVDAQNDKVWIVKITPLDHALPYEEAVTKVADIVADIEQLFAVPAERSVRQETIDWKAERRTNDTKSTKIKLEERVSVVIQLRESDSALDTWFVSLAFAYEASRK
jgi:hypothetical protein